MHLISWKSPLQTKKKCLKDHQLPAQDGFAECDQRAATPPSTIDLQEMLSWLEESKKKCKAIDDDVKDAKRRVNAAKGPKKKTNKALPAEDASDAASEAADSEAWFINEITILVSSSLVVKQNAPLYLITLV